MKLMMKADGEVERIVHAADVAAHSGCYRLDEDPLGNANSDLAGT